ncbi:MAG: 4'-phosphopantetheinyl transferase superfamily protein, partial [Candidatus Hydrogenedentales bacterium]
MRFDSEQPWVTPAGAPALAADAVHVWRASLVLDDAAHDHARRLLAPDERARADRFLRPVHGRRFTAARAALRQVLAQYLDAAPERISFEYTRQRKPYLPAGQNPREIQFNLSHSGDVAIIAIVFGRDIGVDIEHMAPLRDWSGVAQRYFAPEEAAELQRLPDAERLTAFYRCWTRKEAYLKAGGDGLTR